MPTDQEKQAAADSISKVLLITAQLKDTVNAEMKVSKLEGLESTINLLNRFEERYKIHFFEVTGREFVKQ